MTGQGSPSKSHTPLPSGITVQELKQMTAMRMAQHHERQRQQQPPFPSSFPFSSSPPAPAASQHASPPQSHRSLGGNGGAAMQSPPSSSSAAVAAAVVDPLPSSHHHSHRPAHHQRHHPHVLPTPAGLANDHASGEMSSRSKLQGGAAGGASSSSKIQAAVAANAVAAASAIAASAAGGAIPTTTSSSSSSTPQGAPAKQPAALPTSSSTASQQNGGGGGSVSAATSASGVTPMPHGLTVQELKELTRMRLAREAGIVAYQQQQPSSSSSPAAAAALQGGAALPTEGQANPTSLQQQAQAQTYAGVAAAAAAAVAGASPPNVVDVAGGPAEAAGITSRIQGPSSNSPSASSALDLSPPLPSRSWVPPPPAAATASKEVKQVAQHQFHSEDGVVRGGGKGEGSTASIPIMRDGPRPSTSGGTRQQPTPPQPPFSSSFPPLSSFGTVFEAAMAARVGAAVPPALLDFVPPTEAVVPSAQLGIEKEIGGGVAASSAGMEGSNVSSSSSSAASKPAKGGEAATGTAASTTTTASTKPRPPKIGMRVMVPSPRSLMVRSGSRDDLSLFMPSIRQRSISQSSEMEDLPRQMAEYVLLTPKSPTSPHIGGGNPFLSVLAPNLQHPHQKFNDSSMDDFPEASRSPSGRSGRVLGEKPRGFGLDSASRRNGFRVGEDGGVQESGVQSDDEVERERGRDYSFRSFPRLGREDSVEEEGRMPDGLSPATRELERLKREAAADPKNVSDEMLSSVSPSQGFFLRLPTRGRRGALSSSASAGSS